MAAGVNGSILIEADISFGGAPVGSSAKSEGINIKKLLQFSGGNGALGLADVCYHAKLNRAGSANADIDLSGVLTDAFGALVANAEVMAIIVLADAANVNNVQMKPGAANGFLGPFGAAANVVSIEPGDAICLMSTKGWAVTNATGDLLNFANSSSGTAVNFEVLIVGRSIVG